MLILKYVVIWHVGIRGIKHRFYITCLQNLISKGKYFLQMDLLPTINKPLETRKK